MFCHHSINVSCSLAKGSVISPRTGSECSSSLFSCFLPSAVSQPEKTLRVTVGLSLGGRHRVGLREGK